MHFDVQEVERARRPLFPRPEGARETRAELAVSGQAGTPLRQVVCIYITFSGLNIILNAIWFILICLFPFWT